MKRETVLVIGAGASFGARSVDPRPPLGGKLADYLLRWFDANAPSPDDHEWRFRMSSPLDGAAPAASLFDDDPDIRPILVRAAERAKASATAFEEIMEELLRDRDRRALEKVNRVICVSLLGGRVTAFAPGVDLYDQLFLRLGPSLRSIITPNYDLLAEEALDRVGLSHRYRADHLGNAKADIVLDKFHGSANWFQPSGVGRSHDPDAAARMAKPLKAVAQVNVLSFYNDHPVYAPPAHSRQNAFFELKRGMVPVLVTYGPGKDAMSGRPHLDRVRAECIADLEQNVPSRLIALGISPPRGAGDDDTWESLCKVFSTLDCTKEYWSGSPEERTKMAAYGFDGRDGWFEDLLASLPP